MNPRDLAVASCLTLSAWALPCTGMGMAVQFLAQRDLADLSLEELSSIVITTASKREETRMEAPASVFVITREEIRRSGATSIAEALRLAPGVEVARRGPDTWAISMRGFNSDITNKLLVLIDGRSVYSPLYAGVFWDVQDTLVEDIDRIEVIAGPGGTLWGANAVNGVVNIITRSAFDTEGGYVEIGGGSREPRSGGIRYGARLGADAAARVYVKYFDVDRDSDERDGAQGGFRLDWEPLASDRLTLQGDVYRGGKEGLFRADVELGAPPGPPFRDEQVVAGHNLLGRWVRPLAGGFDMRLQAYYDHTRRDIPGTYNERRDTFDVDFQHGFRPADRHEVLWGLGFRITRDELDNTLFATFDPASRTDRTYSAFVQDKIDLRQRRLFLTLGSKFEHNDYTGFELQPNARLSWLIDERRMVWAAVSRAVRIPSRLDTDLTVTTPPFSVPDIPQPVHVVVEGSEDFESEELLAYEAGYRLQARADLSLDLALFYNDYDRLRTQESETPVFEDDYILLPNTASNGMRGRAYGGTFAVNWQPVSTWNVQAHYAHLDMRLRSRPDSLDPSAPLIAGNGPRHQYALRSYLDLPYGLDLYLGLRWVDDLPNLDVGSYAAVDASLRWWPSDDLELSLTGVNLTDRRHVEFTSDGSYRVERAVYGRIGWRF